MTYRETVSKVARELFYLLSKHISRSISRATERKGLCLLHGEPILSHRWNRRCGINLVLRVYFYDWQLFNGRRGGIRISFFIYYFIELLYNRVIYNMYTRSNYYLLVTLLLQSIFIMPCVYISIYSNFKHVLLSFRMVVIREPYKFTFTSSLILSVRILLVSCVRSMFLTNIRRYKDGISSDFLWIFFNPLSLLWMESGVALEINR